ncbi:MAG: hypothetical protein ACXVB9_17890 [Bdellovibrionota bacterium]
MKAEIPLVSITGEVIFESVHHNVHKKAFKEFAHRAIARRVRELPAPLDWVSYLVIVSPGQSYDEVRCQVDVEASNGYAGFAIGFGLRPNHAFNDAIERMQWYEKNSPLRLTS